MNTDTSVNYGYSNEDYQMEQLKKEQNLGMGIVGGLVGALIGAIIWALIAVISDYQIGIIAIAVGFLAGKGVSILGKGLTIPFQIIGATFAFIGVVLGKVLSILAYVSDINQEPLLTVIKTTNFDSIINLLSLTFEPMDLLFYAFAIYEGFKYSLRVLAVEDLQNDNIQEPQV